MWYMFDNHQDQEAKLREAGITVLVASVKKPRTVEGIAFPDTDRAKVFKLLGINAKATWKATETDVENVQLIELTEATAAKAHRKVTWQRDHGRAESEETTTRVLQEFADRLGRDIVVGNIGGHLSHPGTDPDIVYIRFCSVPKATSGTKITRAFGVDLGYYASGAYSPTGGGEQILDEEKTVVAEIHGNTIYVLFQFGEMAEGNDAERCLRGIMEGYHELIDPKLRRKREAQRRKEEREHQAKLKLEAKERVARLKREAIEQREKHRPAYIRECGRRLGKIQAETDKGLEDCNEKLHKISLEMVELTRRSQELGQKKAQLDKSVQSLDGQFAQEYDKLLEVPHVVKVEVPREGRVWIFTDTLYLTYKGRRYELGDYRIEIRADGDLYILNLRAKELTKQEVYQHPHVFYADGSRVCLGNIREGITRLIGDYEYSVAAMMLIEFLQTVTDAHQYIGYLTQYWKPMPEPKAKKGAEG